MSRAHTKIFDKVIQSVICFIHWVTTITCTYRAHRAQPKYIVQHYRPIYFIASNLFDVCIHSILAQWHSRRIDELVSHFIPFVAMHAATRRLNYNFFLSPTTKAIWRLFRLQCNWRIIKKYFYRCGDATAEIIDSMNFKLHQGSTDGIAMTRGQFVCAQLHSESMRWL